jgi:hypothetical protein
MNDKFILLESLADDEQWKQWEKEADELELPLDYYIAEFL